MDFFFLIFSFLATFSSVMVVASSNPVHSVFFLILVFCFASFLLLRLTVDFLSIIFIVVYVGAVAVLFLFVVMMLNVKLTELSESIVRYVPLGIFLGVIFFSELAYVVQKDFVGGTPSGSYSWAALIRGGESINLFGEVLYTHYLHIFMASGMVLLVSMIGAISLTLNHSINVRRQLVYRQVGRDSRKAVFLYK
jgi:NADH-quinone oxidoreductase subunit J